MKQRENGPHDMQCNPTVRQDFQRKRGKGGISREKGKKKKLMWHVGFFIRSRPICRTQMGLVTLRSNMAAHERASGRPAMVAKHACYLPHTTLS